MANTSSDLNFKPICYGSPHPLLELASIKMALNIWLAKFNEIYKPGTKSQIQITELEFNADMPTSIPPKIKTMIDAQMYPITLKLDHWVTYLHSSSVKLSYNQIYTRLNLAAFGGNGNIHFKDTIANFLEDDSLDIKTRFIIACDHCMEEKIDFLWPLVSDTLLVEHFRSKNNFMPRYWIYRKKGELSRMRFKGYSCIEHFMIVECYQWSKDLAVEYFLTLLNPCTRLCEINMMFDPRPTMVYEFNYGECEGFFRLFPNIDGPTQRQIFDKYTVKILYTFVQRLNPIEYAVQCFLYIRNIITPETYGQIIITILDKFHLSHSAKGYLHTRLEIILEQIWLNAPPHMKKYALESIYTILDAYSNSKPVHESLLNFGRDIRFLLAVLSDVDAQLRNIVWIKYWPKWIVGVPPCQFEELMGLCLSKTEAIEKFKSTLPYAEEFQEYCGRLIRTGRFTELDQFLRALYSNPEQFLDIKKHILANETAIFSNDLEDVEKYAKYIDNSFGVLATDFKNNLIVSDPVSKVLLQRGIFDSCDDYSDIESIVSLFVLPQKLSEIKNKFLESFRRMITNGQLHPFYESCWSKFLVWCSDNDEQRVIEFKESLEIDVVFEAAFYECVQVRDIQPHITSLNRFLMWYFTSRSTAKSYVCGRNEYYDKMDGEEVERKFRHCYQYVNSMRNELLSNFYSAKRKRT